MNNLEPGRNRFFDFDLGHVTEAGKVENCRFLENLTYFHLNLRKTWKSGMKIFGFFSTLHVQIGKIFEKSIFSNFDFRAFGILRLKSIEKWPRSLIFIEICRAIFEKPTIFDFTGFCHVT